MFKSLQMKMTLMYAAILIAVLLATNISIYLLMDNYNKYELSSEVESMLGSINNSEWLYEQDTQKSDSEGKPVNPSDLAHDNTSDILILPTAEELVIPQTLNTFQFYMVFNNAQELVRKKSDNAVVFTALLNEETKLQSYGKPTIVKIDSSTKHHYYLIAKMPIAIQGKSLGSYVVARDVTVAFETIANLVKILTFSFIAGVLFSVGLGYFLAGRSLEPIKEAYHSKQTFLANASHELKTPISVILLSTEALESEMEEATEFQRQTVADIKDEATKMNELVTHLLLLARNDSSKWHFNSEHINMSELLSDEVNRYQAVAQAKQIQLSQTIDEGLTYKGDRKLLQSLFSILIDNAIKYSQGGGLVDVELKKGLAKSQYAIELRVRDTGVGISEVEMEKIFERFYRVESSRSKETGGYGLGLAMAKEIAEQHNATIKAKSVEGQGTEFVVAFK